MRSAPGGGCPPRGFSLPPPWGPPTVGAAVSAWASIFSIKMPYPLVGSSIITWVTAPTSCPPWRIGEPDMPWTIPPVRAMSSGSVTRMRRFWVPESSTTRTSSTSKVSTASPLMLERISAGPVWTWSGAATATACPRAKSHWFRTPNTPRSVLAQRLPMSSVRLKLPRSSPGSPALPFLTALTEASITAPSPSGIRRPVSLSVIPWPRAPKAPVAGS